MKQEVKIGQTDYSVFILIRDTTGAPKTGLAYDDAGSDVSYVRIETDNDAVVTACALATLASLTAEHSDWGFLEVDATNHPGLYRLDIADGVFAAGAWSAVVTFIGTDLDPTHLEFVLVPVAPIDGVDVKSVAGTAQTANDNGADINTLVTEVGKVPKSDAAVSWNSTALAAIEGEVEDALQAMNLDHLLKEAESGDVTTDSVIGKLASTDGDWSKFVKGTDSLQSIRDALVDSNPASHSATANNETGNTTLDGGTYANTATADASYYQTGPGEAVGGFGLNCDLTFGIGTGRIATSVQVLGYFDAGAQRTVQVWAYDYILADYVQLSNSTTDFNNASSNQVFEYILTTTMVQISDGEVKIRFTSTSETATDVWNVDRVIVTSIAQAAAGLTADLIQLAVWGRSGEGHDVETLGHSLASQHLQHALVSSATDATQFIIDAGSAANDAYNGCRILLHDITDDHHEVRQVIDYIGATKEVFVDRAFTITPAAGDIVVILSDYSALVWDLLSALGISYGELIDRTYQLIQNKLNITNATGDATLRTIGDGGDLATWNISDDDTTTVRTEGSWP